MAEIARLDDELFQLRQTHAEQTKLLTDRALAAERELCELQNFRFALAGIKEALKCL